MIFRIPRQPVLIPVPFDPHGIRLYVGWLLGGGTHAVGRCISLCKGVTSGESEVSVVRAGTGEWVTLFGLKPQREVKLLLGLLI